MMIGRRPCLRFILETTVAVPGSIDSKRITAKPAREGFVSMCAWTEPVSTGIGAVCVEYGRPKWPTTMLNHTNRHPWYRKNVFIFIFYFWQPMLVRPAMKRLFASTQKTVSVASIPRPCLIIILLPGTRNWW